MHSVCAGLRHMGLQHRWGRWTRVTTTNPKAMSDWYLITKEQLDFSNSFSLDIETICKEGSMPSSRWPTSSKLKGIFEFLSHIASFRHFFLHDFFACILWFLIYFFMVSFFICFFCFFLWFFYYLFFFCLFCLLYEERKRKCHEVNWAHGGKDLEGVREGEAIIRNIVWKMLIKKHENNREHWNHKTKITSWQ